MINGTLFLESAWLTHFALKKTNQPNNNKTLWFSIILFYCISLIYYNYFHGIFYFEIYSLPILKPKSLFRYLETENFCFEMWPFVCKGLFGTFLFRVVEWKCCNLCLYTCLYTDYSFAYSVSCNQDRMYFTCVSSL